MLGLTLEWIKTQGGVESMSKTNKLKSAMVYEVIDSSDGFYWCVPPTAPPTAPPQQLTFECRPRSLNDNPPTTPHQLFFIAEEAF